MRRKRGEFALALVLVALGAGCDGSGIGADSAKPARDAAAASDAAVASDAARPSEGGGGPPNGPELCGRAGDDIVRDVFCVDPPAEITSLEALQKALRLTPGRTGAYSLETMRGSVGQPTLLGHSTSLSGRLASPINPRALLFRSVEQIALAFQRGVQQVEITTRDRQDQELNFYLLRFRQACNDSQDGCTPGDLYTPAVERGWSDLQLQDDEELKNTPADCRQCHQRGLDEPVLLMRELKNPWTHFFVPSADSGDAAADAGTGLPAALEGQQLMQSYLAARGDEPYANIPMDLLQTSIGILLENFVSVTTNKQPLFFDSLTIHEELYQAATEGGALRSATWDRGYAAFKRGEQLPLPYYLPSAADPDKLERLTRAYRSYVDGELPASELPDLADIYPDDPQVRAEIGLQTEPGATPAQALVQACGSCHNDVLDPSLSRARFNIALSRMDRAERTLAVERIQLQPDEPGVMPPPQFRQLDGEAREALIEYLRRDSRPAADDEMLERAAELGMAGGQQP